MGLLMFIAALIIAGIFMAYGESGSRSAVEIASRLFGPERGPQITELCTATIRAVAQGVVGIAFIQMLLVGVAFVLMGIPGAGLLALAVLLLGHHADAGHADHHPGDRLRLQPPKASARRPSSSPSMSSSPAWPITCSSPCCSVAVSMYRCRWC